MCGRVKQRKLSCVFFFFFSGERWSREAAPLRVRLAESNGAVWYSLFPCRISAGHPRIKGLPWEGVRDIRLSSASYSPYFSSGHVPLYTAISYSALEFRKHSVVFVGVPSVTHNMGKCAPNLSHVPSAVPRTSSNLPKKKSSQLGDDDLPSGAML